MSETSPTPAKPTITLQLGGLKLTGAAGLIGLLVILGGIVWLVIRLHPAFGWSWLWVSAALWLAFIVYWSKEAANASAIRRAESARSRALHNGLMNLSLLLLFLRLPGLTGRWLPATAAVIGAGLAVHAASFALAAWARRHLGRHWSYAVAEKEGHELVRSGPYRVIRHPIYSAMIGMTIGTALVSGETHALLATVILGGAYARKILLEERNLAQVFGADWMEYRTKSWALVPWVV
jgi:protein-S-isoprenylcysteine O-methyltransferase Ste14